VRVIESYGIEDVRKKLKVKSEIQRKFHKENEMIR
jgi:hypothetical protein